MLKKDWRKAVIWLVFMFFASLSYAQYVVTGGAGSPLRAEQTTGDSAERIEVPIRIRLSAFSILKFLSGPPLA